MRPLSAHATPVNQPLKKWTVLQFGAADNDLGKYIYDDVAQIERVGSDDKANLVVQLDMGGADGAKRYLLEKKTGMGMGPHGMIESPVVEDLGPVNMADPKALADFLQWGMQKYPAEHYMLLISDHGKGWKGCVMDNSHQGWMTLPALKAGLEQAYKATGKRLDLIGFDACLMASTEVAYQLKDQAKYLVASQEIEGQEGWPYNAILKPEAVAKLQMAASGPGEDPMGPRQLAESLVARGGNDPHNLPTFSAIDLSKMDALGEALKNFKENLSATLASRKDLRMLRGQTQAFSDYHDLYDFAEKVAQDESLCDPSLRDSAEAVRKAVETAVIAEQHSDKYANAHGLTMELKFARGAYKETDLDKAVGWSQAVAVLNS